MPENLFMLTQGYNKIINKCKISFKWAIAIFKTNVVYGVTHEMLALRIDPNPHCSNKWIYSTIQLHHTPDGT